MELDEFFFLSLSTSNKFFEFKYLYEYIYDYLFLNIGEILSELLSMHHYS